MTATVMSLKRMDRRHAFLGQNRLARMSMSVPMYSENGLNVRLLIVGRGSDCLGVMGMTLW